MSWKSCALSVCLAALGLTTSPDPTYIADACCSLADVIEGAVDVEQSHMDAMHNSDTLLTGIEHWHQVFPLVFCQAPNCLLYPGFDVEHGVPAWGRVPVSSGPVLSLQLIFETHQQLVQQVRSKRVKKDKCTTACQWWQPLLGWVYLHDVNILLTQSLVP